MRQLSDANVGAGRAAPLQPGETLPEVFWGAVAARGDAVFMRSKSLGVWASMSWRETGAAVREAAAGMMALGVQPGQVVCTVSHTRAECVVADLAALSIGAVSAAAPPGLVPDMAGLCREAGAELVIVEHDDQLAGLWGVDGLAPAGVRFVVMNSDAAPGAEVAGAWTWHTLLEAGRKALASDGCALDGRRAAWLPSSPAVLSCSAGTTAAPVWVQHSHEAVLATCRALHQRVPHMQSDTRLSFLSWARVNERLLGIYLPVLAGMSVNFCEGPDTVPENLREVAPTIVSAMPRQLETLQGQVIATLDDAGRLPRAAFEWALKCGDEVVRKVMLGQPLSLALRVKCELGRVVVLGNVRRFMGLDNCRHLIALDTQMPASLVSWYMAMGVPLVQVWGTAQTLGVSTVNALPDFRPGSVGRPLATGQVQVEESSGELLLQPMHGLATKDGASDRVMVRSGDLGHIDLDGFVAVTGRATERLRASTGETIPASRIQALLCESPYVQDALVFGDGRPFATALILLMREKIERHAHRVGMSFPDFEGLTRAPEIRALLQLQVDLANEQLAPAHRVQRFQLIEADLEPGGAEMTPTLLLRRWALGPQRLQQIEAMYL